MPKYMSWKVVRRLCSAEIAAVRELVHSKKLCNESEPPGYVLSMPVKRVIYMFTAMVNKAVSSVTV